MKILYDHQAFTMQRYGGVSRCFVELVNNLNPNLNANLNHGVETQIIVRETDNVYLRDMGIGRPMGYAYNHFILPGHFPLKWTLFRKWHNVKDGMPFDADYSWFINKQESIKALKKGDFDVFHPTFFDDYFLPYLNGKPFVLTIHDMIPELYPQYFDKDKDMQIVSKRRLAPLASAIIAVSEKTKEDVVRILHVPEEKVYVIYHGSEHIKGFQSFKVSEFQRVSEGSSQGEAKLGLRLGLRLGFPYLLYVGARWQYKNFGPFMEAVAPVLKRHEELKVVCTGDDFSEEECRQMDSLGIRDRFVHHWVHGDEELSCLYHDAVCFVYTSEYEGFGIPILEAYKADCPVMLNNASCFPEIAGNAAVYFTLTAQGSDFATQFEKLYSWTPEERQQMIASQRERLNLYSWKKSAQQLTEVYRSVIGHADSAD